MLVVCVRCCAAIPLINTRLLPPLCLLSRSTLALRVCFRRSVTGAHLDFLAATQAEHLRSWITRDLSMGASNTSADSQWHGPERREALVLWRTR
jgi:hypothetical protein